jgi:uncharacterized protein
MMKIKTVAPILLVVFYTILILLASNYLKTSQLFFVSDNNYINFQCNYQLILLLVTAFSLLTSYLLNRDNFKSYFSFGAIKAPAQKMSFFGIKENDSWLKTGVSLVFVISTATGIFMYLQLKETGVDWSLPFGEMGWVLLFALTNSFGEEMIYRMGIVSPLKDVLAPQTIFIISAILFGVPHLAGMPSGILGATMAGILGLVLAKSLAETKGFFWAWSIHFVQDVIIIASLFLLMK